ncbi:MAG: serine/threonine protein kinase [Polyangiales bacterium]
MVAARELPRNLAGRQLGRYEVLTQLASGGMAAVYVARALGVAGFERLVAIKVLHPHLAYEEEFVSMFLDEARLAARIRHPNVVPTLDISDTEGDGFFLVMQYIEGDHFGSLLGHAARGGERIPARATVRIVLDALGGLGAAHELTDEFGDPLKLVHRDVSPHNVMVSIDGSAHLTDFGVAKAEKRLSSTRAGQFKGKLAYMAPEQASTGFADQRSDLFSMGIILWEALTGRRLFRAENNAATLTKILHEAIPLPSELWDDLHAYDDLMAKVLHRDADQRFQTADEFADALEDAAATHEGIAKPREIGEVMKRWLGERIADQNTRLRESIDLLGRSDYSEAAIPIPMESSASNVTMSGRPRPPSHNSAVLSVDTLDSVELSSASDVVLVEPGNKNKRKALVLATLIAAILLGALLAVILATPDPQPPIVSSPLLDIEPPAGGGDQEAQPQAEAEPNPTPTVVENVDVDVEGDPELEAVTEPSDGDEASVMNRRHEDRNHRSHMRHRQRETEMAPEVMAETPMVAVPTPMETVTRPSGMGGDSSSMMNDLELNPYR